MKKIAFMFAAAAMVVACAEAPKTATQEQKDSILNVLKAAEQAKADAIVAVFPEGEEIVLTQEDSAKILADVQAQKDAIIAAADTANEAFKAAYEAAIVEFEAALNAPAAPAAEEPAAE